MSDFYHSGHRALQQEFESTALAERLEELIVRPALDAEAQAFVQAQDHFFLTTVDQEGFPTVSYKGGNQGFVQIVNETTLRFPCYDGNGMWLSIGNITDTSKVGMLFINMVEPHRIRLQGQARLLRDAHILKQWKDVALAVEVSITKTWFNCPRYIHPMAKLGDSGHVPSEDRETEPAQWKSLEAVADVLPPQPHELKKTTS